MARAAYQMALANPKISAEVIEVNEFPELGQRYGVRAVPLTVIADKVAIPGMVHERILVEQVMKAVQSSVGEPPASSGYPAWASADSVVVKVDYSYKMIWPIALGTTFPLSTTVSMRIE